jgi:phosphatidylserine/phosphatidylglycerophosphate/cardiolipin synthase-like enzyme
MGQSILDVGRNCRAVASANRIGFVIDGDDYFKSFMKAAERAQHSIIIIAWDFNSNCCLDVAAHRKDARATLGGFLNDLARRRRGLHIYVLDWDFPMIYAKDREAPVAVRLGWGWKPHKRVHLEFDNTHPPGGSHHQKIVIIDDAIAFCGGLDLTCQRWDTSEHAPNQPDRVVGDVPYPPFHDMMIIVDGDAARELGRLARERWSASTGEQIPAVRTANDPWPPDLQPALENTPVAIAVTAPESAPHDGEREVEALYLDMIARARRYIYIENQYFTSHSIGNALEARLREAGGPEVIVVTRLLSHGWLEEYTMGVLRSKTVQRLRAADSEGRFSVFFPAMPGLAEGTCIDLHSKMMAVDDEWLRVGSANINNRSMGVDTECDLAIEAGGRADVSAAIRRFRDLLLAEHLGVPRAEVERALSAQGSIAAAIRSLHGPGRTLEPLEVETYSDVTLSLAELADPEKAVGLDKLFALFSFGAEFHSVPRPVRKALPYVMLAGSLFLLWRFTPLRKVLRFDRAASSATRLLKQLTR